MNIVIIGSGNVATQLGIALFRASHKVVQVYSRSMDNAQRLAKLVDSDATSDVNMLRTDADVFIYAVKDDALPVLAEAIAPRCPDALHVHTAGSVGMNVFEGSAKSYGVLYPMQTFSRERMVDFSVIPCFVEGSDAHVEERIAMLAASVSGTVVPLSSEKRKSLHLAAVFACNFTNHCYHLAERVLTDAGLDFKLYLPLIDETARKVHDLSPRKAQTGPAVRYDETVMNRHLDMIDDELMRKIYQLMSESIHLSI